MGEQAASYWDGKSRSLYYSKVKILMLFLITFSHFENIIGTQLLLDDEHPQQLVVSRIIFGDICHMVFPYSMILNVVHGEYNIYDIS